MKNKSLILLVFFSLIFGNVIGQMDFVDGYIVTNQGDTIKGFVGINSNMLNSKTCHFKKNMESATIIYYPTNIKAYKVGMDKFYVSKELTIDGNKQVVFLEFLVSGIANLYYLENNGRCFYLEKDREFYKLSNDLIESKDEYGRDNIRNSKKYIGVLNVAFNDSPLPYEKLAGTKFNYKSLINITKDYHNSICDSYDCIIYTKSTKLAYMLEPYIGIRKFGSYKTILVSNMGAKVRIKPIMTNYGLNILLGLGYSYTSSYEYSESDFSIVEIPVAIEYTLPGKYIKPYFSVSWFSSLSFYKEVYWEYSVPAEKGAFKYNFPNFSLGFGIKHELKSKSYTFLKMEIGQQTISDRYAEPFMSISTGYGFNLKK